MARLTPSAVEGSTEPAASPARSSPGEPGARVVTTSGPATLSLTLNAADNLNPDARRRASPVVLRLYELKAPTLFEQADFVTLFEKEQAALAAELIGRDEMVVKPGDKKTITKTLSPDARAIGVMAAYRDLERARWRAVIPVAPTKKNVATIELGEVAVLAKRVKP